MKALVGWLENRTGIFALLHEALYERVPGGARWRYVWGSTLVFAFVVQAITGIFLWMAYSPSSQTAWESVYYIQHQMWGGWLLRGVHHFMAQTMVVLLVLHLMQVVIDGAYRAPREFNFWLGLILMKLVLALALTGYLLPWDQRGYWSTGVATSLMSLVPYVGEHVQKLVVGGSEYGHHTLTRFFALHAGVLPALLVMFLVLHVAIFRKHGIHPKKEDPAKDCYFWPDQVLKDAVACLAVLLVVLFLVFKPVIMGDVPIETVKQPDAGAHLGAHMTAPADPSNKFSAARPEWYFLFLFQFLKFFHGESAERWGAIYIPGILMGVLFLMPILGRWKLGHRFNVLFLFVVMLGAVGLTAQAWHDDNMSVAPQQIAGAIQKVPGFEATEPKMQASKDYVKAEHQAQEESHRIVELVRANGGVPALGAVSLLRNDPKTQGPLLFARHCASCHSHKDKDGNGIVAEKPSAPNLYGFGSREWLTGFFDPKQIAGPDYFGGTKHKSPDEDGQMVGIVQGDLADKKAEVAKMIIALSAEAKLKSQAAKDAADAKTIADGPTLFGDLSCGDCHKIGEVGDLGLGGPDLTGWASRQWLIDFISDPSHERFYEGKKNDRMPSFYKDPANPKGNKLSHREVEMIADWLRGEWPVWHKPETAKDAKPEEAKPGEGKKSPTEVIAAAKTGSPSPSPTMGPSPTTGPASSPGASPSAKPTPSPSPSPSPSPTKK
jgi:ubiquinol-cytochrome c reductase cytochrome b subunit